MSGRTSTPRAIGTTRLLAIGLTLAAILALGAWGTAPAAHASSCENSWTNNKGGSWFAAENWSKKAVPTSTEEVCITESGTYTVQMTQTAATVTVKALTIGAVTGTQTLAEASSCSLSAVLTSTSGLSIGAQGALTMTNGDGCGENVTLVGPVANGGTITTIPANGGERNLQGGLTNTGTLAVNVNTHFNGTKASLANQGAINLVEGAQLQVSGENTVTNGTGGKITGTGNGAVVLTGGGTSFTEGAGTTSGTKPVIVEDGALTYSGAGAGPIALRGAGKLAGTSSAGQSLALESTCSKNTTITAAAGFTNGGAMTLTNGDGCGDNVTLAITGLLSNSGSISVLPANGGERNLQGSVTNTGTMNVNATTHYNASKTTLTNDGTINVAEGKALQVTAEGAMTNGASGKIVGTGTGAVVLSGGGTTYTEGAGTTTGTKPVIVEDGALVYSGSGESTIAVRGTSSLAGSLAGGQLLSLESTCGKNTVVSVAASLTNGGAITLTNADGCADNVTLNVASAATLTNSGSLTVEHVNGGGRTITGRITNTGTLAINSATTLSGAESMLTNKASVSIATGVALTLTGAGASNEGGTITGIGSGVLVQTGATFTEGAGKTAGAKPVILEDGSLIYSGSGEGPIALRGTSTLSGGPSAGQSLSVESTCSKNVAITIAASLTSTGSIVMTNADGCADNATLTISSGATVTNSGMLSIEHVNGGGRTVTGELTNKGTINVSSNALLSSSVLLNEGSINIAEGVTLSVIGSTVTNDAGTITGTGSGVLVQSGGGFNQGGGKTVGTQPVVLEDAALNYTGKGASTIALRGVGSVTGTVVKGVAGFPNKGQTLSLQSTCGKNATITASGAFTNSGTIVMTNGDGCGNNVTLSLGGGTLTNKGAIKVEEPHGGSRTIEASVLNEKTITVTAGANLKVPGAYTQSKKGTFATGVASASSFGVLTSTGAASIGGSLSVVQAKGFTAAEGQKYAVLGGSALTGTFAKVKGNKIKKSKPAIKYNPVYSGIGVTLQVGP